MDLTFDYTFPSESIELPSTPPDMSFAFDPSYLNLPYNHGHVRSTSKSSVYSAISSTVESTPDSVCTRMTTPPRASPPVHQHGPLLLPKIRSQDQDIDASCAAIPTYAVPRHVKTSTPPPARTSQAKAFRPSHARSFTDSDALANMAFAHMSFSSAAQSDDRSSAPLLCSPAIFAQDSAMSSRRASTCSLEPSAMDQYAYSGYRPASFVQSTTPQPDFSFSSSYEPREASPLSISATPEPMPSTTLLTFLTAPNPAASLVRSISFPMRDPNTKNFWWDIRNIRSWSDFNASAILNLPGASALLTTPIPASVLSQPSLTARHPETESALHSIYASYYLPKLNSSLAISSSRPLQLSVPSRSGINDLLFVANADGDAASAAAMFGGKPSARVVGLVRSFDRFNTGMRVESNIKRVEYLRGLAAIHYAMREHGCRYGFILTEIELVVVRNGTERTPFFGDLDVTSVQLAAAALEGDISSSPAGTPPLTACLALWGLCQLASDEPRAGNALWRAEIGAPAEGTRRKARPRDKWMPQPQLAEKREAKRSRGWVWPEDAIGRKELGRRGVRYGGI